MAASKYSKVRDVHVNGYLGWRNAGVPPAIYFEVTNAR